MTTTAPQTVREKHHLAGHGNALASLRSRLQIGTALAGMVLPLSVPGLALAADECGTPVGGVVTCTATGNPYAGGITYGGIADLTLNLSADAEVRTSTAGVQGVTVVGGGDALVLNLQGRVVTEGANSHALQTMSNGAESIAIDAASVATQGENSSGIWAWTSTGDIDINVGGASTTGDNATAVNANSMSGTVKANNTGTISTTGNSSHGIVATSSDGDVSVSNSGAVATTGDGAFGIIAESTLGKATVVNSGSVTTTGAGSHAIRAVNDQGDIVISNSGSIKTTGAASDAILANANTGNVKVTSTGTVTTIDGTAISAESNLGNVLIDVTSASAGGAGRAINGHSMEGDIDVKVGSASTTGEEGSVIYLYGANGNLTLDAGTLTSQGGRFLWRLRNDRCREYRSEGELHRHPGSRKHWHLGGHDLRSDRHRHRVNHNGR